MVIPPEGLEESFSLRAGQPWAAEQNNLKLAVKHEAEGVFQIGMMILCRFIVPRHLFHIVLKQFYTYYIENMLFLTGSVAVELSIVIYVVSSGLIHILPSKTPTKPQM